MFAPPFCPYRRCPAHTDPDLDHYTPHGNYQPKCRNRPVPRFRCRSCRRTYSRQTFRMDYRDHKPHLNRELFKLLVSGVGLRQSSRMLTLSLRCTELKFRKIARHLRRFNLTHRAPLIGPVDLQLDEIETFEGRRRERPVTFPILIEANSRVIIWGEAAPIAPKGRMSPKRIAALEEERKKRPARKSNSSIVVRRTLERAIPLLEGRTKIRIQTDEKSTYPGLISAALGEERVEHTTTNSKVRRDQKNPLTPINHTEAIARDLLGRIRRRSWLASKKRRYLDLGFQMLMAWKNYWRPRFNTDSETAAEYAGFTARRFTWGELLGWRQEFGPGRLPAAASFKD